MSDDTVTFHQSGVPVYPVADGSRGAPVMWIDPTTDLPVVPTDLVAGAVAKSLEVVQRNLDARLGQIPQNITDALNGADIAGKVNAAVTAANIPQLVASGITAQDIAGKIAAAITAANIGAQVAAAVSAQGIPAQVTAAVASANIAKQVSDAIAALGLDAMVQSKVTTAVQAMVTAPDVPQIVVPTAGSTVAAAAATTALLLNNTSVLATLTITLPPTPKDMQRFLVSANAAITLLTLNGGTIRGPALTSLAVGGWARFLYSSTLNAWSRVG